MVRVFLLKSHRAKKRQGIDGSGLFALTSLAVSFRVCEGTSVRWASEGGQEDLCNAVLVCIQIAGGQNRDRRRRVELAVAGWVKQDRRSSSEVMFGSMTAGCWAVTRTHPCRQNGERWKRNWARRAGFPLDWYSNRAKAHRRRSATLLDTQSSSNSDDPTGFRVWGEGW